jgi:hypothetical protein
MALLKMIEEIISTEMITDFKRRGTVFMSIHKNNKGEKGSKVGKVWRNYQMNTADGMDTLRLHVDELWELDMGYIKAHFSYWVNCSPTKPSPKIYTVCSHGMVQEGKLCGMPIHITGHVDNTRETMIYKVHMDMDDITNFIKRTFHRLAQKLDGSSFSSMAELKRRIMYDSGF